MVACLEAMEVEVNSTRGDTCLRLSRSTMVHQLLVLMDSRVMERMGMVNKDMEAIMGTIVVMGATGVTGATGITAAATDIMGMVVGGKLDT